MTSAINFFHLLYTFSSLSLFFIPADERHGVGSHAAYHEGVHQSREGNKKDVPCFYLKPEGRGMVWEPHRGLFISFLLPCYLLLIQQLLLKKVYPRRFLRFTHKSTIAKSASKKILFHWNVYGRDPVHTIPKHRKIIPQVLYVWPYVISSGTIFSSQVGKKSPISAEQN